MCHTYEGRGGTDAPDLDFMRGKMTANDIANMSGLIWNHVHGRPVVDSHGLQRPPSERRSSTITAIARAASQRSATTSGPTASKLCEKAPSISTRVGP